MDPAFLAMVIETAGFLLVVVVMAILMKKLFARAVGITPSGASAIVPSGGWSDLATRFAASAPPETLAARAATLMVGSTVWKNCVSVGAGPEGLRLAVKMPIFGGVGKPPLLVPWSEIVETAPTALHWKAARILVVGRPTIATITLPEPLYRTVAAAGGLPFAA